MSRNTFPEPQPDGSSFVASVATKGILPITAGLRSFPVAVLGCWVVRPRDVGYRAVEGCLGMLPCT